MPGLTPGRRWQPAYTPFKKQDFGDRALQVLERSVKGPLFGCRMCGNCLLQATAYQMGMEGPHFEEFYPDRPVDASHPDILLDFNRCILCELCVRASAEVDGKSVFALSGRGIGKHLVVNAESGRLADTDLAVTDKAVDVCPVGAIIRKRVGFSVPIGHRRFDVSSVRDQARRDAPAPATDGSRR